jgi:hypothetical protein
MMPQTTDTHAVEPPEAPDLCHDCHYEISECSCFYPPEPWDD